MRAVLSIILLSTLTIISCSKPVHKYKGYVSATNIYLAAQFAGTLEHLAVKKGDKVKKGDLLFKLDDKPQIFNLNESKALLGQTQASLTDLKKPKRAQELKAIEAQLAQNQAQISLATIRDKRNQTLFDKHVLAKDSLDLAKEHLNELLAKKDQITAELELAKLGAREDKIKSEEFHVKSIKIKIKNLYWNLTKKKMYAPDDGYIFDTYFVESELIPAGRPVISLLTKKNIYIEFFVPLIEFKNLKIGTKVNYNYLSDDNEIHTAEITYISPEAEYIPPLIYSRDNMEKLVFRLKASPLNNNKLIPGLPITVSVEQNHVK